MKQIKLTVNKKRVKINTNIMVAGLVIVFLLLTTLIFSVRLEYLFKLKPDFRSVYENSLEVHFVNVGQGDSILVRFPTGENMIIDAGTKSASDNLVHYIDNVFFRNTNNKVFDYFLLTHSDSDHSGGAYKVLTNFTVNTFFRPRIYSQAAESEFIKQNPNVTVTTTDVYEQLINHVLLLENENNMEVVFSEAGIKLGTTSTGSVEFLSPNIYKYTDTNDYSPIIMVSFNDQKVMLTGDATFKVENEVMNNYDRDFLDVDVLKLGHHGSKTSTSRQFLETVKPEYAIVSAGKNNSYNHPSPETIDIINSYSQEFNSTLKDNILNTADLGNIVFYVNPNEEIDLMVVANSNDYIYISWWVVVAGASGIILVITARSSVKINTGKATRL